MTDSGDQAVIVDSLCKSFGDKQVLDNLSFVAESGSVLGVLGPNGAGKTTTIKILSTLIRPTSGTAKVAGFDVRRQGHQVRQSIMVTGQYAAVDMALSGYQNLVFFGRLMGLRKPAARARANDLLEQFELEHAGNRAVSTYSGGMRRRLDLACGLVIKPAVMFLDEPTTGLDPQARNGVFDLVRKLRDEGTTILLTTQYLEEADILSDSIIVIDHGRKIAAGTADELKDLAGGTHCHIELAEAKDLLMAEVALGDLISRPLTRDNHATEISIPTADGPRTLAEAVRRLDGAGIPLADISLRRPTLDDVFFSLTQTSNGKA